MSIYATAYDFRIKERLITAATRTIELTITRDEGFF
jgi:hypothetical protein